VRRLCLGIEGVRGLEKKRLIRMIAIYIAIPSSRNFGEGMRDEKYPGYQTDEGDWS